MSYRCPHCGSEPVAHLNQLCTACVQLAEAEDDGFDDGDGWCMECGDEFHLDDCGGYNPPCSCGFHCRSCHEAIGARKDEYERAEDSYPEEYTT